MKCLKLMVALVLVLGLLALGFVYSGVYPVGADREHHRITHWLLETMRDQSVKRAASGLEVPGNLDEPDRLLAGGEDYNAMCTGCHLKPGVTKSDLSQGLYPAPPNLTRQHTYSENGEAELRRQFWIIKHGIKASGMPAWGPTHSDERIWSMVAFLQRLPELTPQQYQILTGRPASQ